METKKPRILVVRKMSTLEYRYGGNHPDPILHESKREQDKNNSFIESLLKQEGCEYDIVTRRQIAGWMVEKYDYVFSAGGDGTAIAAAYFNADKPQLNLKNDSRSAGALCQHNIEDAIRKTLTGNFHIEEWTRQDVFLDSQYIGRALNDVVAGEQLKIYKYAKYHLNDVLQETEEFQGNSGIVFVTGTGSTGWPGAFKPFSRNSKELRYATAFHNKGAESGTGESFKITYKNHNGKFTLDCAEELEQDLPWGSVLEVRVSEYPLKVIIPNT